MENFFNNYKLHLIIVTYLLK